MYFAHSSDKERGVSFPQSYNDHVSNVTGMAGDYWISATKNSKLPPDTISLMEDVVLLSAIYHDLGKLSDQPQSILKSDRADNVDVKMLNHVDAGVALLIKKHEETNNIAYLLAAFFVHAHHLGLENIDRVIETHVDRSKKLMTDSYVPNKKTIRDNRDVYETYGVGTVGTTVRQYIDSNLGDLDKIHVAETNLTYVPKTNLVGIHSSCTAIVFRIAFSCLVDADHTDTEIFYSKKTKKSFKYAPLNPSGRRLLLKDHIDKMKIDTSTVSSERLKSRNNLRNICANSAIPNGVDFFLLDGPVGTGKTFSGIDYAFRLAEKKQCERIYGIIPYTNIISQMVEQLRSSVLFDGENIHNVNEIHNKCEFEDIWMRKYSSKWNAPINVSTMVQFGESLATNRTGRIRKLHWFANSVIFFDEFDKAMPHDYWQFFIFVLKEMSVGFNVSYIFSSGTSACYWDIFDSDIYVHDIINKKTRKQFEKLEKNRCKIKKIKRPILNVSAFMKRVAKGVSNKNSGLLVFNTINNACVIATIMRKSSLFSAYEVYELTGYQDPSLKEKILKTVRLALKDPNRKVILVATSTIECGVDISFDIGWREKCGPLNIFQCKGRVNRGSVANSAVLYTFELHPNIIGREKPFTENPDIVNSVKVFDCINPRSLSHTKCTSYVEKELELQCSVDGKTFLRNETSLNFKNVGNDFKIIDSVTATVVVDKDIVEKIKKGENIHSSEISRHSVQIWVDKIEKIEELTGNSVISKLGDEEYYEWRGEYNEQNGIGSTMLTLR